MERQNKSKRILAPLSTRKTNKAQLACQLEKESRANMNEINATREYLTYRRRDLKHVWESSFANVYVLVGFDDYDVKKTNAVGFCS